MLNFDNLKNIDYIREKQKALIIARRTASGKNLSYAELAEAGKHFEKLGKRFGLLREFKENGIC